MAFVDAPYVPLAGELEPYTIEESPALFDVARDLPFAEVGVQIKPEIDEAIGFANEAYARLGADRFLEEELAELVYDPETGTPYFAYGEPDADTAVVYYYPFEAGCDVRLNVRTWLLKQVLDHIGLVGEDGKPLRVVGFPSPVGGKAKGVNMKLPARDIYQMLTRNDHHSYTESQLRTLQKMGITNLIPIGFSLGGMLAPLSAEHALDMVDDFDVKGVISASNPGNARTAKTKPGAMANCLHRLTRSGGDTVAEIVEAGFQPLVELIPTNRQGGRRLSRWEGLRDNLTIVARVVARPANLGLWGVMAEASTTPAVEKLLSSGVPITWALSDRDQVPHPEAWLPELTRLHKLGNGLMTVHVLPNHSHDIGSNPRTMTALYLEGIRRALSNDGLPPEESSPTSENVALAA